MTQYLAFNGWTDKVGEFHQETHVVEADTAHDASLLLQARMGRRPRRLYKMVEIPDDFYDDEDWYEEHFG
ncbi:MAG: hypothetical protein OJJ55_19005 [Rhodococcus sp.]|nr:hypothetical protein [Rhodococcus sp. (in: high G+C Gram-positive bacteria)]